MVLKLDDSDEVFPFYIKNRSYEVKIGSLSPGTYNFQVSSNDSEENREGSFFVDNYSLEEANISPNIQDLKRLADQSGGAVFYIDNYESL